MPDDLRAALLDLLCELDGTGADVMLGGGYGLFLKQEHLASSGATTLIPSDRWPEARSTNDIDLLLRPEIVTRAEHMGSIRKALDRLGFEPVDAAKFYQFVKSLGGGRSVKVDFLAGPLGEQDDAKRVRLDSRRIRPRRSVGLHAHRADEAVAYDSAPLTIPVSGRRSNGQPARREVVIPQAFSYALMKLFAFRDRKEDAESEFAQHHALDLYRIVAMLTEDEYAVAKRLASENRENERVIEAREIVSECFGDPDALGILRMREHPLFTDHLDVREFLEALADIVPRSGG